jgi:23S rRNA (guanosine2251-2'-O)-methyltransferase
MDVGNMGAIIRSAVAAEADGIVLVSKNSAPINETVVKTSSGAVFHANIVQSTHIINDINYLKERNFWLIGAVRDKGMIYTDYDFSYPTAIIMGNEHSGLSQSISKQVDQFLTIPIQRKVESLNVSVATAILLFEARRQKALIAKT